MKKLKNFNKTLNYKILSALPVIGVCLTATHQTSSAMFKNSLNFFRKLEKSPSGVSSPITKPLTTSKIGGSSMISGGSKLPVQTSSGLNTKPSTSTTTPTSTPSISSSFGANPKIFPTEGPDPSSSSFQDKLRFFSSMGAQSTTSILGAKTTTLPTTSTTSTPTTSSNLGTRPKTTTSTTTKPTSTQTSVNPINYKDDLTNLIKEGSSKILKSLYEIHTSDGKNKINLTTEVKNLKANVTLLSKRSYQDKFKKHYPNEDELKTNAANFGSSISDYVLDELNPKVNLFIDYIVTENNHNKVQQKIQQLSSEFGDYIGTRANNDLRVRLLAFK